MIYNDDAANRLGPEFDEWLQYGMLHGWCGPAVCYAHDGVPMSAAEDDYFINGGDPCIHILRLYEDRETREAVEANFIPYGWRMPSSPADGECPTNDAPF